MANEWAFGDGPVTIYERVGEGRYKRRVRFDYVGSDSASKKTIVWTDENGDEQPQDSERQTLDGNLKFGGWWMKMSPDLSICTDHAMYKVSGFTPCGSPKYDFAHPTKIANQSVPSTDGRLSPQGGDYSVEHGLLRCFDIASGKRLWTYPDNYVGVHGSHNACGPTVGMLRGSYAPVGSVKLPEPLGNVWVIPTNMGEWHIVTERGFYIAKLFEGDPLKVRFPEEAVPGAIMDSAPPGGGQEDFGGNIALGQRRRRAGDDVRRRGHRRLPARDRPRRRPEA